MLSTTRLFSPVALALSLSLLAANPAAAQPVPGTATFSATGGYARLVLKLNEDVESDVSVAGTVLLIRFKKPVNIPIGRLSESVPDYVSSARRDPDGSAIRLALSRKVKVNTMTAGERIYIDLLPDNWKGPLPSLPQEVIAELAERARNAERALRLQRSADDGKPLPPIRMRASVQPTFVRFSFELPDGVAVTSTRTERMLSMAFNAPLRFDLADAKLSAPPNVASIMERVEQERTLIEFALLGEMDVHTFREGRHQFIDVGSVAPGRMPGAGLIPGANNGAKSGSSDRPSKAAPAKPSGEKSQGDKAQSDKVEPDRSRAASPPPTAAPEPGKVEPKAELKVELKPEVKADSTSDKGSAVAPSAPVAVAGPNNDAPPAGATPSGTSAVEVKASTSAPTSARQSAEINRSSDGVRVKIRLEQTSPAALFRRGEILWLVLDNVHPIDLSAVKKDGGALISDISSIKLDGGQAIRIRLDRPQLASLTTDPEVEGRDWTIALADSRQTASRPLTAVRNIAERSQSNVGITLAGPGAIHRLVDPDAGDTLKVVTALPPSQGFIRQQDFVEFTLMESVHGIVVQPKDDALSIDVSSDKVIITRSGGLTLSAADAAPQRASSIARPIFDVGQWRDDQSADFVERLASLTLAVVNAEAAERMQARIDLARFYMARAMYHEAKGVADLALADSRTGQENPIALIVRSVANVMINRPDETLKDVSNPVLGPGYDSEVWKGLAFAAKRNWVQAREKFLNAGMAVSSLPVDLQRVIVMQGARAALEVKDFSTAAKRIAELELLETPGDLKFSVMLLSGWLDEALGRDSDALRKYAMVADSDVRGAAAEAKLRDVAMRLKRKELKPEESPR